MRQSTPSMGKKRLEKETVFLAGTDRVQDVLAVLYSKLKGMGFEPWWFRKPNFPQSYDDAMESCLDAATKCDRLVLVIDERAGLPYKRLGVPISEAEFEAAHSRSAPCLVFVRARVWEQARVYHRHLKDGPMTPERFADLKLDGDMAVYALIEKLQHKDKGGRSAVPWITPFSLGDEIPAVIREKWVLPRKVEAKVLRTAAEALATDRVHWRESYSARGVEVEKDALAYIDALTVAEHAKIHQRIDRLFQLSLDQAVTTNMVTIERRVSDRAKEILLTLRVGDIRVRCVAQVNREDWPLSGHLKSLRIVEIDRRRRAS
jgi:hypothetical protein